MRPCNEDEISMNALATWTEALEEREAKRRGVSREAARPFLAERLRVLPGTLENIVRRRVKEPRERIKELVRNAFIREMEDEIKRLHHGIFMAVQSGTRPDDDEIIEAQTHIETAKRLIGK